MKLRRPPVESIAVDDLVFAVRWSRRRRTIGISVSRDGGLRVLAPAGVAARRLESTVREKLPWVRRKLAEFGALGPPPAAAELRGRRAPALPGRRTVPALARRRPAARRRPGRPAPRPLRARPRPRTARRAPPSWAGTRNVRGGNWRGRVAHFEPLVDATPARVVIRDLGVAPLGRLRRAHPHHHLPLGARPQAPADRRLRRGARARPPARAQPRHGVLAARGRVSCPTTRSAASACGTAATPSSSDVA